MGIAWTLYVFCGLKVLLRLDTLPPEQRIPAILVYAGIGLFMMFVQHVGPKDKSAGAGGFSGGNRGSRHR